MPNAIEMLTDDHRKVKELFKQFEKAEEDGAKEHIVVNTIRELEVHAAVEEEIFYPAARDLLAESEKEEIIDEAGEEHHVAKLLMAELKKMSAGDERYDAKFTVLCESVEHHIDEEESELFPMLKGDLDMEELGRRIEARKQKLERQASNRSGPKRSRSRAGKSKTAGARRTRGKKRRAASGRG